MKIKSLGSNKTLVKIGDHEIFISYETPVAGFISGIGYFKTSQYFSSTTSKHINQYLKGISKITIIPQDRIDKFLNEPTNKYHIMNE
jgi:hypothetical protein